MLNSARFRSNPFSTRYIQPGKLPWFETPTSTVAAMILDFEQLNRRCAIVGPHGAGKSTLLEHMIPQLGSVVFQRDGTGKEVSRAVAKPRPPAGQAPWIVWLQLRRSVDSSLTIPWEMVSRGDLLVLDGYEQLSPSRRCWVAAKTFLCGVGLLVTSHHPTVLPTLCHLHVSATIAQQIIRHLVPQNGSMHFLEDYDLEKSLAVHSGSMREVLLELYDQFESWSPAGC